MKKFLQDIALFTACTLVLGASVLVGAGIAGFITDALYPSYSQEQPPVAVLPIFSQNYNSAVFGEGVVIRDIKLCPVTGQP